jgi:RHS repeat-associated protein
VGAPQELTDKEGRIVWAADYKVWGEATLRKTGTDGAVRYARQSEPPPPVLEQPFRFQGQQFDEETGLHYNRYRYYDPGVGRFVSQDPIGLRGGSNLFAYAPNPLGWVDPFGLAKKNSNCPSCSDEKNQEVTSREARREAMRKEKIPTSQQPISQSQNNSGMEYRYETSKPGGGTEMKSVQQQTLDRSHPNQGHWEAGTVKTDPMTGEIRINDYGRPKLVNNKSKVDYDID